MPTPGLLTGASPLQWSAKVLPPQRAGGPALELGGAAQIRAVSPNEDGSSQNARATVFAKDYLFAGGKFLAELGTRGLLPPKWGTVLSIESDDSVEVEVAQNDLGRVLAVGLVAASGRVTLRTRLPRTVRKPGLGDTFTFDRHSYVVTHVGRAMTTRSVRELSVTGMRWDDLPSSATAYDGGLHWT